MKGLSSNRTLNIFTNLHRSAHSFEQAAVELTSTAKEMMDFSGENNNKSNGFKRNFTEINDDFLTISSAVEEFTINMKSISDNANQSLKNIDLLSDSTSDFSNAATEIAQNTGSAKDYSVKVLNMDDQHKRIFEYINQVHTELKLKSPINSLIPIMQDLIDFTTNHFADEQVLMKKINYSGLSRQISEHTALLSQAAEWFFNHIKIEDQKYSIPMNQNGIK